MWREITWLQIHWVLLMLFSLVFSGCNDTPAGDNTREDVMATEENVLKVDSRLVLQKKIAVGGQPFDMLAIPGTTQILVSDRFGKNIVVTKDDIVVKRLAVSIPNRTIVFGGTAFQSGLFGLVADPAYPTNNYLYLFLTLRSLQDSGYANQAVIRLTYNSTTMTLKPIQETDILLEDVNRYLAETEAYLRDHSNGGSLLFLPDGTLLASFGYQAAHASVQNMNMLGGKIIRMFPNGKPVCGDSLGEIEANPFCRSDFATNPTPTPRDYIYTLGHKNSQGLALARGRVFASEHGESGGDELNALTPGGNYGFPHFCSGGCLAYTGHSIGTVNPLQEEQKKSFQRNFIFPQYTWNGFGHSIAPSGMAFYPYDGPYKNNLIVTTLAARAVFFFYVDRNFNLTFSREARANELSHGVMLSGLRFRDVLIADNGNVLYILTNGGGYIYKFTFRAQETAARE